MSLGTAVRYWETLRWLRPQQVYGRAWFRLYRPKPDTRPAPPTRAMPGQWTPPACRDISLLAPTRFRFLNEDADLETVGWPAKGMSRLWQYNLHYFDDLNARGSQARRAWHGDLIANWIARNPPAHGAGWESYPTSLRIVNWIKWALGGAATPPGFADSLAAQARWLRCRLETHLLGNHLFANAKALLFAGLWFDGSEASAWRRKAFEILHRETAEQILADGAHFERTSMYHALAFEDVLDLINLCRAHAGVLTTREAALLSSWQDLVPRMGQTLAALSHPDGQISFFNDAAFGIAPPNAELFSYGGRLGLPAEPIAGPSLNESGYARLSTGDAVVLCDLAKIGPDYLPGHAHADTLSFEMSLFGQRLFVNSGTSVYEECSERCRQRGTAAHNTVTVGGENSSDVWSSFRVGFRARIIDARVNSSQSVQTATGSHDGYRALPGRPIHTRVWTLRPGRLSIEDSLSQGHHTAEARYHLHPSVTISLTGDHTGDLILPGGQIVHFEATEVPLRVEPTTWHPEFGASEPNQCLVLTLVGGFAGLALTWTPQET